MKLKKVTAILIAASVASSTPAGAYLGQLSAYAKSSDDEDVKDYSISDAAWDEEIDSDGKVHVYATWSESDDKASASISISVNEHKQSTGSISTTTTAGRKELTSYIRKINKEGTYTFKITSQKKNKGEDEKSSSESEGLEIDKEYLKSLATTSSSSSSSNSSSGSGKGPTVTPTASGNNSGPQGSSPADAMNNSQQGQTSQTTEETEAPKSGWEDWKYGWVYFEDGQLVKDRWVLYKDKYYHLNSTGFMDVNTYVNDNGIHFVGADGALVF